MLPAASTRISTHTPLAGRDLIEYVENVRDSIFLLTRPSRDVTEKSLKGRSRSPFLLTRPSRDVTPVH